MDVDSSCCVHVDCRPVLDWARHNTPRAPLPRNPANPMAHMTSCCTQGSTVQQVDTSATVKLYAHNQYLAGNSISTTPGDVVFGVKVGPYTNTWFISYNDMPCTGNGVPCVAQGATLYFKTPVPGVPYLLKNAYNLVDFCPRM